MRVTSLAFGDQQLMPHKYTCDGENVSPPLRIEGVSGRAQSLVLIVHDPDSPRGDWMHWLMWNIPVETNLIQENVVPVGAIEGMNDFWMRGYGGPCPPVGQTHKYHFKVFALDTVLNFDSQASRSDLEQAIVGHVVEVDELVGMYRRQE